MGRDLKPPPKEPFNFRISHTLRDRLRMAAIANSRSATAELEDRLSRSFTFEDMQTALRTVLDETGLITRKSRRSRRKVTAHHTHV